jgi:outer membrane autotransporter protein
MRRWALSAALCAFSGAAFGQGQLNLGIGDFTVGSDPRMWNVPGYSVPNAGPGAFVEGGKLTEDLPPGHPNHDQDFQWLPDNSTAGQIGDLDAPYNLNNVDISGAPYTVYGGIDGNYLYLAAVVQDDTDFTGPGSTQPAQFRSDSIEFRIAPEGHAAPPNWNSNNQVGVAIISAPRDGSNTNEPVYDNWSDNNLTPGTDYEIWRTENTASGYVVAVRVDLTALGIAPGDPLRINVVSKNQIFDDTSDDANRVWLTGDLTASDIGESLNNTNNWLLALLFPQQIYAYGSAPVSAQGFGRAVLGTLAERHGHRGGSDYAEHDVNGMQWSSWARLIGVTGELDSANGDGVTDHQIGAVQAGVDIPFFEGESGEVVGSVMIHAGSLSSSTLAFSSVTSSANSEAVGLGAALTWFGADGFYADMVGQATWYDVNFSSPTSSAQTDGLGLSLSGEAGYRVPIGDMVDLVPQGQLVYQSIDFDDMVDSLGSNVVFDNAESLELRGGTAIESSWYTPSQETEITGFVEANLVHEFLDGGGATVGVVPLDNDLSGTSFEAGFGLTVVDVGGFNLFGEIDYRRRLDGRGSEVEATGGIEIVW